MGFNKRLLIYIGFIICLTVISLAAIGATSTRNLTTIDPNPDLELNINGSPSNQFDSKRKCLAKKNEKKMGHWKSMMSKNIEPKLQAAIDAGKLTQKEADAKREFITKTQNKKMGHWKSMASKNIEPKLQAAIDAGKLTQKEADTKRECSSSK